MDEKELIALAEKVKAGTATKEETLKFYEEFNKLLTEIKDTLKA